MAIFLAIFFGICHQHWIWISVACRNLFFFAGHMRHQSVTLLGLSTAFDGLCHRPEPAHH